jgi:hypothetical protein
MKTCVLLSVGIVLAAAAPLQAQQREAPNRSAPLPPGYIRLPIPVQPQRAPKMRVVELPTVHSKTYRVTLGAGDEIVSGLTDFAEQHHIVSAHITGIGGLLTAKLGWTDPKFRALKEIDVTRKCELVSLVGNISLARGHPYVHLHAVVSFFDGSTQGGHVIEARVAPIAEIYVVTTDAAPPASGQSTSR